MRHFLTVIATAPILMVIASGAGAQATPPAQTPPPTPQTPAADRPLFDFQVEKPVAVLPNQPAPKYPEPLKVTKMEGQVIVKFVVDTNGMAEMTTFEVIKSSHELFSQSVRAALPTIKFTPAQVGGRKVRQLIQMPFVFSLAKTPPSGVSPPRN